MLETVSPDHTFQISIAIVDFVLSIFVRVFIYSAVRNIGKTGPFIVISKSLALSYKKKAFTRVSLRGTVVTIRANEPTLETGQNVRQRPPLLNDCTM